MRDSFEIRRHGLDRTDIFSLRESNFSVPSSGDYLLIKGAVKKSDGADVVFAMYVSDSDMEDLFRYWLQVKTDREAEDG